MPGRAGSAPCARNSRRWAIYWPRRENDLRRHGDAVRLWFGGALVAVVGLAALVSLVTGRILRDQLLKPLGEVVDAVRQIRAGDLEHPVPVVGPRELHELSSAIDEMRRSILQLLQAEVASRQALEQEAVVTLQLSGSLASTSGDLPDGWHSAAHLRPAEGIVAGDCYVMDLLGPDRIGLAVLDISGHGAAAALTALKAKEIIRSALAFGRRSGPGFGDGAGRLGGRAPFSPRSWR